MSERPGIMFRFDILDAIEKLDISDAGRIFISALKYGRDGTEPDFDSPILSIVWALLRPSIDADGKNYAEKILQKKYAVYCREAKKQEQEILSFDAWRASADITRYQPMSGDIQYNTIQNQSNNNPSSSTIQNKPSTPTKKKYGQYGWVKLTSEEYQRLVKDIGQAEVERCINYVDESAQATGNKNRWKDWNLVIRKCSRDRWGVKEKLGGQADDYWA